MSTKKLQILDSLGFVSYNEQTLTDEQKVQARANVGAGTSDFSGSWDDLSEKPFGEEVTNTRTLVKEFTLETSNVEYGTYSLFDLVNLSDTSVTTPVVVTVDGIEYESVAAIENTSIVIKLDNGVTIAQTIAECDCYIIDSEGVLTYPCTIKIERIDEVLIVNTIDEKFIPSTIARTSDIPEHTWESLPDKPFWKISESLSGVEIPLTSVSSFISIQTYKYISDVNPLPTLIEGKEYRISIDLYDSNNDKVLNVYGDNVLIAGANNGQPYIGDLNVILNTDAAGGFFYGYIDDGYYLAISHSSNTISYAVVNFSGVSSVQTLDEEFIPDTITRTSDIPDAVINPATASVGQTIVVKTVDESGKPTEWEAVDLGTLASKSEVAKSDLATDVQTSLGLADTALQSYTETDPTVPDWAKASTKPTYTAEEVGADASGTADSIVSTHNTATDAHNDIRLLVTDLTTRLNTLADSDDTTLDQMSEIVAYIKSNKTLIEEVTTNKVNVSDIIDNLTTNVSNQPLSAAQGVALKALIDALQIEVNNKALASDLTSHTGNTSNPHGVTKAQVGLENVDNVKQYSASNPPPYPVTSVNGATGAVTVSAVPDCSADNNGQFLRVVDGVAAWATIANAEEASF